MPDDPQDITVEGDGSELLGQRGESFFRRLGIPANLFNTGVLQPALAHALVAPTAAPRPWVPLGARNIGGRIRALAQDPHNGATLYAGTAQGGVFRTRDAGDSWEPLGGPQDGFPVGALAVTPSDPRVLYVGTGEPINSPFAGPYPSGLGFFRYDGRVATPQFVNEVGPAAAAPPVPNGGANNYARIVVDPANLDRCWIACHTGLWRREAGPLRFVREPVPAPPPPAGTLGPNATDVALAENWDPARPQTYRIYVAIAGQGIYRGVFDPNAIPPATVWEPGPLGGGLPAAGTFDRVRLALCKSRPQHVYALLEDITARTSDLSTIFHSANGGDGWTAGAKPEAVTYAWYCMALNVHPYNPALVIAGAINQYRSDDFGAHFTQILDSDRYDEGDRAQHSDQHDIVFDATDRFKVWIANDGGVSMTPDVVHGNPRDARTWRKRSHAILAAQFNDITAHPNISAYPNFPYVVGGGLQDNGTYVGFGGPTWYHVGLADGGEMAFELNTARFFYAPTQFHILTSTVVAGNTPPAGLPGLVVRSPVNADLVPPNDIFAVNVTLAPGDGGMTPGPFVSVIAHHPTAPQHLLVGRIGAGFVSNDGGATFVNLGLPGAFVAGEQVSAVAYGPGANADWWIGTSQGRLFLGPNVAPPPAPPAPPPLPPWAVMALPFPVGAANPWISRIAVHPNDNNYVAVATGGTGAAGGTQGRVFLSLDRGANWADVSGLAPVGVPVPGPGWQALPPCPITSLAFDPSVPAGSPQVLFAGTIVGVYVIRNLPARRVPAAVGPIPGFIWRWFSFNNRQLPPPAAVVPGQLPLVLVNDLECVNLAPTPGAPAGSPEAAPRRKLICATFGRGMYECDLAPGGGPRHRLFIRQYGVEDGLSYPRRSPVVLNAAAPPPRLAGDPRTPAGPGVVRFDQTNAFDIRIDSAPFLFFEENVDGVEFDEDIRVKTLDPGEPNVVYVQVQTRGWDVVPLVTVHLYFAPAPAPVVGGAPLPDLHADFWAHFADPVLPAPGAPPVAPAAAWQRVGTPQTLTALRPNQPAVARFDWVPPASLGGGHVGLLAVCTSASDPLPVGLPTVMQTLITNERRAAFRLADVARFVPRLFIRDGVDDDSRNGSVSAGGRSPDIIVVTAEPAAPPEQAFRDLLDERPQDRIKAGVRNLVYVRAHNRSNVDTPTEVELWAVKVNPDNTPSFAPDTWMRLSPTPPAAPLTVVAPANGWAIVKVEWNNPPDPNPGGDYKAYILVALVKSVDNADPVPDKARIDKTRPDALETFWKFFGRFSDSDNAASRALRYDA